MNCLANDESRSIARSSLRRIARPHSMSHRICQFFIRHRRESFSQRLPTTRQDGSITPSLEMRPQTAPSRQYEIEEEDHDERQDVDRVKTGSKVPLSDAEMKAYLIGEHEKNMRLRLRGTKAKVEVDQDMSASGSGMSSSEYESSRSSYARYFPAARKEKENEQTGKRMMNPRGATPENQMKKRSNTPHLKRKGNFRLERALSVSERVSVSSGDEIRFDDDPVTPLRPAPRFRFSHQSIDFPERQNRNSNGISRFREKPETPIRPSHPHQLPSFDFSLKPLPIIPPITTMTTQNKTPKLPEIRNTKLTSTSNKISSYIDTASDLRDTHLTQPKWPSAHHQKSNSTSSKMSSYLGSSADLLDATRRDIQGSLRRNAEAISGILPLDWREKIIDDDADSDESFYCIGEIHEKRLLELDKERRLSGEGEDPWTEGTTQVCRLCKKASTSGLRGLCNNCKAEFRRQRTRVVVGVGGHAGELKAKPPLPLKFRSPISPLNPSSPRVSIASADLVSEAPVVGIIRRPAQSWQLDRGSDAHHNPTNRDSHISQLAAQRDGEESPESRTSYERWKGAAVRAAYRKREQQYPQWSPSLLGELTPRTLTPDASKFGGEHLTPNTSPGTSKPSETILTPGTSKDSEYNSDDSKDVEEILPRVEMKGWKGKGVERSDSFYLFYDDLLKDSERSTYPSI